MFKNITFTSIRSFILDREQRELYEAAKIIQTAYRQYKARLSSQKQLDAERTAAVVIQSYYRRYKQVIYHFILFYTIETSICHASKLYKVFYRFYSFYRITTTTSAD